MLSPASSADISFQHTATRRWLQLALATIGKEAFVSTHSHPKVAAIGWALYLMLSKVSTHSHPKVAAASLKSLAPSGFEAPISLSFQEKREREYNTAFSVIPTFTIF